MIKFAISIALDLAVRTVAVEQPSLDRAFLVSAINTSDIASSTKAIADYEAAVRYRHPSIEVDNARHFACLLAKTQVERGLHPRSLLAATTVLAYAGPGKEALRKKCFELWGGVWPKGSQPLD